MSLPNQFLDFLSQHDDEAWSEIVSALLPDIHPVDRNAVRIWFSFFPVKLHRALAKNEALAVRDLLLIGKYRLSDQVNVSHWFLYGHRHWELAKQAVVTDAKNPPRTSLEQHIRQAARVMPVEPTLALGIAAVAYATLQQVGWENFTRPATPTAKASELSPEVVLRERAKPEPRTFWSSLFRTVDEKFTVCFNENDPTARYQATNLEPLTMAGGKASNPEKYQAQDPRCVAGPIPLECQTGACGTCWVGVLGGGENLNEISPFEAKRLEKIGYPYDGSERPPIRLACKSLCQGPISIVIPPWSGVLSYLPRFEENVARAERPEAAAAK
jgi:hypothetical protein